MTKRQVHLGAHFPGVNATTIWTRPESGSQIDPSSFVHLAQTAERGFMDLMFLAEGLRLREHAGQIHDLDVVGRPDTLVQLAGDERERFESAHSLVPPARSLLAIVRRWISEVPSGIRSIRANR